MDKPKIEEESKQFYDSATAPSTSVNSNEKSFNPSSGLTNNLNPNQIKIFKELVAKTEKFVKLDATSKLLWVDSNVNSAENKIYQKAFIDRGFENLQTMVDMQEFKEELPDLHK